MGKGDYKYIRAWQQVTGGATDSEYTEGVIQKAQEDNAPPTAIFYSQFAGRWVTFEEIERTTTAVNVAKVVEELKAAEKS